MFGRYKGGTRTREFEALQEMLTARVLARFIGKVAIVLEMSHITLTCALFCRFIWVTSRFLAYRSEDQ